MATLYLMVGLPCSGKTTRAKELENELAALRLTPDEWHVRLFGHDIYDPLHDQRHNQIESLLWQVAVRTLSLGTNVILDFGFWAREERAAYRTGAQAVGACSEIIYLHVSETELLRRLHVRNAALNHDVHYIPETLMQSWLEFFQEPDAAELQRRACEDSNTGFVR